jgi:signal transduction histidine kinase
LPSNPIKPLSPFEQHLFFRTKVCGQHEFQCYVDGMNSWKNILQWQQMTLPGQFVLAGAIVMLVAMFFVGNWVAQRIEETVVQNSAAEAALFMESFISPLSQEIAQTDTLSPPARQALAEIFNGTALGERVVSYKIWLANGMVVHASDADVIGQLFNPSDELVTAAGGTIAASFEDLNDIENEAEAALGVPLLEVYSPIREAWTGEIIGVAEFYQRADVLAADIVSARRSSWLVVASAFFGSGLLLFGIVQAGGRTIRRQRAALESQLEETRRVSEQNVHLRSRVVQASSRSTAQTERAIRRIGFDLHDGPAQYLSLAALRLENALASEAGSPKDVEQVRDSLNKALQELRLISRGLALPDLDQMGLPELVERALSDHEKQTELVIARTPLEGYQSALDYAQKLCIFRFLQETLSNISRHADVETAMVFLTRDAATLSVTVSDEGRGFDAKEVRRVRIDGGLGLFGLTDRAESIGGSVDVKSTPGKGSRITLRLPNEGSAK